LVQGGVKKGRATADAKKVEKTPAPLGIQGKNIICSAQQEGSKVWKPRYFRKKKK